MTLAEKLAALTALWSVLVALLGHPLTDESPRATTIVGLAWLLGALSAAVFATLLVLRA